MKPPVETSGRWRWYYGWNIVAVVVLAQIAGNGLPLNTFSLFLHDWSAELHSPISTLQLGPGVYMVVCAVLAPVVGLLSDKYPARLLFGVGLSGIALSCLAMSFVTAAWQILTLYSIFLPVAAMCSGLIPANAVVSRWFVRRLGLALGLVAFGLGMAGVILPPLIAWIMPSVGWRMIWRSAGILIGIVVTLVVVWVLRDRPTEREGLHYVAGDEAAPATHRQNLVGGLTTRDVLTNRSFWLLLAVYLPMLGSYSGYLQNVAPIAASHGLGSTTAGVLVAAFSFSHSVATLAAGLLSDRFGNRLPLAGLAVATALGCILIAFGASLPAIGLGAVLIGLGGGFWPLLAAATAVEFGASGFGRAFGLLLGFMPAVALAPFMIAKVQEMTGSYAPGLSVIAALTLAGGAACLLLRERRV